MAICTRKGCGKEFDPKKSKNGDCCFHPGYTCCKKRVTSFEEFLEIPGCSTGSHSLERETVSSSSPQVSTKTDNENKVSGSLAAAGPALLSMKPVTSVPPPPKPLDQDTPGVEVPVGTKCKRLTCNAEFVSEEVSKGENKCIFHPGQPIFHEGSKGYSCCKPKVLEFEEFLKIKGCKIDKHLFVGTIPESNDITECRTDFYQTQGQVIVSIFAKKAQPDKTVIIFSENNIEVDVVFSENQRYKSTIPLYDLIDPIKSKYTILQTKIELVLTKANATSWPTLSPDPNNRSIITFSAPGGSGTVGAKEIQR